MTHCGRVIITGCGLVHWTLLYLVHSCLTKRLLTFHQKLKDFAQIHVVKNLSWMLQQTGNNIFHPWGGTSSPDIQKSHSCMNERVFCQLELNYQWCIDHMYNFMNCSSTMFKSSQTVYLSEFNLSVNSTTREGGRAVWKPLRCVYLCIAFFPLLVASFLLSGLGGPLQLCSFPSAETLFKMLLPQWSSQHTVSGPRTNTY